MHTITITNNAPTSDFAGEHFEDADVEIKHAGYPMKHEVSIEDDASVAYIDWVEGMTHRVADDERYLNVFEDIADDEEEAFYSFRRDKIEAVIAHMNEHYDGAGHIAYDYSMDDIWGADTPFAVTVAYPLTADSTLADIAREVSTFGRYMDHFIGTDRLIEF